MKKIVSLIAATMLSVFLLSACASAQGITQGFVELPGDVKAGITAVFLVAVSYVLAKLITLISFLKFLEQFREPLAMAIAIELIRVIEVATPDAYGQIVILGLQLILAVLAVFQVFKILKQRGYRLFQ